MSKSVRLTSTVALLAGCGAGMVTATAVDSRSFALTQAGKATIEVYKGKKRVRRVSRTAPSSVI